MMNSTYVPHLRKPLIYYLTNTIAQYGPVGIAIGYQQEELNIHADLGHRIVPTLNYIIVMGNVKINKQGRSIGT